MASRESVVDLLALDGQNPRAILFHLTEIKDQADQLTGGARQGHLTGFARQVLAVQTRAAHLVPETLDAAALHSLRADILGLSGALSDACLL